MFGELFAVSLLPKRAQKSACEELWGFFHKIKVHQQIGRKVLSKQSAEK
jgi:hypothetical protein